MIVCAWVAHCDVLLIDTRASTVETTCQHELRISSQPKQRQASAATTSCVAKRASTVEIDVPTRAANSSQPKQRQASAATTSCVAERASSVKIDVPARAAHSTAASNTARFSRYNIVHLQACEHCPLQHRASPSVRSLSKSTCQHELQTHRSPNNGKLQLPQHRASQSVRALSKLTRQPELRIPSQPPTQHASAATTSCISKRASTVEIDVPTRAANFIAA
jgi:hypothetical protein